MLVPAVTFSPQAPHSADPSGTAEVSAPLGKVSEWIVLAFRCTVRFLPEAALLKLCSRVNLPDPAPSCCFVTGDLGTSCVNSHKVYQGHHIYRIFYKGILKGIPNVF